MNIWRKDPAMTTEYKKDCTKGMSMINPMKYKGDVLVQVWIDSRVLATLSCWLDESGERTRFMSEVMKESLKILCEHLVNNGLVKMMEHTAHARAMLERKYGTNLNPGRKGLKNALHNTVLSDRRGGEMNRTVVKTRNREFSAGEIERAVRIADERMKREESMFDNGERKDFSSTLVVKNKMTDEELEMKAREIEERDRAAREAEEEFMKQFGGGNLPTQGQ